MPVGAPPRLLMVCLGNICRSPTAEAVVRAVAARAGVALEVHSCGTSNFHAGEAADPRTVRHAARRGYDLASHRARQLQPDDFARYDRLLAMDHANLGEMQRLCPAEYRHRLGLFLELMPQGGEREVPDPYAGGPDGFEHVLDLVEQAARALVKTYAATPAA